jgi:flagellar biosynthesis protein FliQ
MKFFQTIAYSLTVWLLAALVNGLLFALFFAITHADATHVISFLPVVMCSLIFSAPGIFCFWLFFYVSVCNGKGGQPLFRALLVAGSICAGCCGFAAGFLFEEYLKVYWMLTGTLSVIAAGISLFAHRGALISFNKPLTILHHV